MRPAVALAALMSLTACFDAEMTLDFVDAETLEVSSVTKMSRDIYDMSTMGGKDPCEGGEGTVTAEDYTCVQKVTAEIDQVVAGGLDQVGMEDFELGRGLTLTRDDANTVTVSFDLAAMTTASDPSDPLAGLDKAMAPMLVGHSVIFRVRGHEIVSTSGLLSEDGKQAEVVIPMTAIATGELPVASPFVTTVKLEAHCRLFGLFCD